MARIRAHLARAPILEALIDFSVRSSKGVDLEAVKALASSVPGYVQQGPIFQLETVWNVTKEEGARDRSRSQELGVRLHSPDGRFVLQVRTSGFTLSRLEPYETWGGLIAEARRLWGIYVGRLQPEAIVRVATRFINHLKLPMKAGEDFKVYLTTPPNVPEELPQGLLGFMQRTVIIHPQLDARANLIQLLQEGVAPADHVPIILDIDVYKMVNLPAETEVAWNLLGELRVFKNAAFFASLTEKTVGLFE
jgi:uncharacterized protein (TIGR04255 family)